MIIPIDEDYRLASDVRCWSIQKSRRRKDRKTGDPITERTAIQWYTSLEQTVKGLGELMVRTSDAQTLTEALEAVERVTTTLGQALAPNFRVTANIGDC